MAIDEQHKLQLKIGDLTEEIKDLKDTVKRLSKKVDLLDGQVDLLKDNQKSIYKRARIDSSKYALESAASREKNKSRYMMDGVEYKKRQFARAAIMKYYNAHPQITYEELIHVFPGSTQGSLGCIRRYAEAKGYKNCESHFFMSKDSIIHLDSEDYVICSDWNVENIRKLAKILKGLGYEFEAYEL